MSTDEHLKVAGTTALWVLVIVVVVPLALTVLCCLGAIALGVLGAANGPDLTR